MEAPSYSARVRPRAAACERGEALEAVGLGRRLTNAQILALRAVGYSISERQPPPDRPWGPEDRAVILRLAHARGWSALAVAMSLQRGPPTRPPVAPVHGCLGVFSIRGAVGQSRRHFTGTADARCDAAGIEQTH